MSDLPLLAVLVPEETRETCFSKGDWERLRGRCRLNIIGEGDRQIESARAMKDTEIVLTGWGSCGLTEEVLAPAPSLKLWVHAAGSMAGFVSEALWQRNPAMTGANDVLGRGVAEYALALTIMSLKQAVPARDRLKADRLWYEAHRLLRIRELCDMTVGIAGFGSVGRHLARLLASFRGIEILVYDPFVSDERIQEYGAVRAGALMDLFERSTVVHNCLPATETTVKVIGEAHLRRLADGAIFISTGRGRTLDEEALIEELRRGRLYACLDVTDPEPPVDGSPFFDLPNLFLTPHIAGALGNARKLLGRFSVDEILRYLDGQPLQGQLSRRDVETMTGGPGIVREEG